MVQMKIPAFFIHIESANSHIGDVLALGKDPIISYVMGLITYHDGVFT